MDGATRDLSREIETFRKLLPSLSIEEGRYAVIAGDDLIGLYDTYVDALQAGYAARGLAPFLVKQVAAVEVSANFTRAFRAA